MGHMGGMKNACKILIGYTWRKYRLGIPRFKSEIGILGCESAGLIQLPLGVSCCEHCDEPSRSVKGWVFFDQQS